MLKRFSDLVADYWWVIILSWIGGVALICAVTPKWDSITHDGDIAYLPDDLDSVAGERLLEKAFPTGRSKSEMVVVLARNDHALTVADVQVVDRIAARLKNLFAVSRHHRGEKTPSAATLREALELDPELGLAWNNLAFHYQANNDADEAAKHQQMATDFDRSIEVPGRELLPKIDHSLPILDVWTYRHPIFGKQLGSRDKKAQLLVVRLSQEFMATENLRLLDEVKQVITDVRAITPIPDGLAIGLTGSASVGSEMLQSSAESIANTELYTVLLVIGILLLVYRAPLLVTVPLVTIVVSVVVSTRLVAALTQVHLLPGFQWWDFKVFTTTKIFVVVILFGAGTDFCLFMISRFREELSKGNCNSESVANTIEGVSSALIGSALTTIVGLAMMFFAEFGKFRNSGPAIGFCLAITLLASITLGPSLLRAFGSLVFWPFGIRERSSRFTAFWEFAAMTIVANPVRVLVTCLIGLMPFVFAGTSVKVTYNFLSELSPTMPSRVGTELIRRHFPLGETGPLVVLAKTTHPLATDEGANAILDLTRKLYVEGVISVRSLAAPRGDIPQGYSIRTTAIKAHEITRALYLSNQPEFDRNVSRFELILKHDPFSIESIDTLNRVEELLMNESVRPESIWEEAEFRFTGTTSAIRDLRTITRGDNIKIQLLVVLGVLIVLLLLLKRPIICIYLIASVLLSYYAALGATEMFFKFAYGSTFEGLDWKVPLFLFVILVAIGQDYNIYLVTRIFEEQKQHGQFGGLRRAIVQTGGIITSCGIIMAGTFVSMTTGTLRGIVELGFALSLGVMLDTFIVRPILVPSFLALLFRANAARSEIGSFLKSHPSAP